MLVDPVRQPYRYVFFVFSIYKIKYKRKNLGQVNLERKVDFTDCETVYKLFLMN